MIEKALSNGSISWQGLVKSIDYLDLEAPIKRIVGKWWRRWIKTEPQSERSRQVGRGNEEEDEDEDTPGTRKVRKFFDEDEEEADQAGEDDNVDMERDSRVAEAIGEGIEDDMLGALEKL